MPSALHNAGRRCALFICEKPLTASFSIPWAMSRRSSTVLLFNSSYVCGINTLLVSLGLDGKRRNVPRSFLRHVLAGDIVLFEEPPPQMTRRRLFTIDLDVESAA